MSGVTLTSHAYRQLAIEARHAEDGNETGGLLLGCDLGMGPGFVVRLCGDPGPNAVRQSTNFTRDLAHSAMLAERAAEIDGSVWIGEWHTHPAGLSMPSAYDLLTYRWLLANREVDFPRLLSLIVLAAEDGGWTPPRIFAWSISANSIRQLSIAIEDDPQLPERDKAPCG
jgi:integrative and conjugative element protein (TIGR02256 family)